MFLEFVVYLIGFYLFSGISIYSYSVIKSYEMTDVWNFSIDKDFVAGIWTYPRWLLFWVEWITRIFKRR